MEAIKFDYSKLNKQDQKIYDAMSDYEKQQFEKIWVTAETQKVKLQQLKNHSKERVIRDRKVLAERERRERNHRLIERGAILEAHISSFTDFTNDEIKEIVERCISSSYGKKVVEEIRNRKVLFKANEEETNDSNDIQVDNTLR